ncbi:hypothetical protein ONS96_009760 [Cadophora gregata f. sp. sojae]|nr:hypothetical protein ONS96_009760 [Cadophora gregata f. sp. sojae]
MDKSMTNTSHPITSRNTKHPIIQCFCFSLGCAGQSPSKRSVSPLFLILESTSTLPNQSSSILLSISEQQQEQAFGARYREGKKGLSISQHSTS